MGRMKRTRSITDVYHIIVRGIDRQIIFREPEDYRRMSTTIGRYKASCGFELYAYCLMDNHIHMLIRERDEPLGSIMKRIGDSYVFWYNQKYDRCGHLFQDRFRSEAVEDERYLITVWRYILQNPLAAGICKKPEDYPYSSTCEYIEGRAGITDIDAFEQLVADMDLRDLLRSQEEVEISMDKEIRHRMRDSEAVAFVMKEDDLQNKDKKAQAICIKRLIDRGITIRQLSRLSGISRGQISYRLQQLKLDRF